MQTITTTALPALMCRCVSRQEKRRIWKVAPRKTSKKLRSATWSWQVSQDDPLGPAKPCRVVRVFHNAPQRVWQVTIRNGVTNDTQTIRVTGEHPFFVKDKGWVQVKYLEPGDTFRNIKGEFTQVFVEKTLESEAVPVYNFEVEGAHTYFVGEKIDDAVLVHNVCPVCHSPNCDGNSTAWVRWSPLRALYTGYGNACDNLYNDALLAGGESYNQNKGYAHAALQVADTFEPTGITGTCDNILTDIENGNSTYVIVFHAAEGVAGNLPRKAAKISTAADGAADVISNFRNNKRRQISQPPKHPVPEIDPTGKVHGDLPTSIPSHWTMDDLEEAKEALEESIKQRKLEQIKLGEDGPHRRRITEEEGILKIITKKISGS